MKPLSAAITLLLLAAAPAMAQQMQHQHAGMPVEPGSLAILEVHYYVGNDPAPAPDQSTVLLRLDEEVEHVGSTFPIADPLWVFGHTMEIPDGSEALDVRYAYTIQEPSHLHEVGMHMHRLGVGGSVRVHHASGGDTCAIQIDNWDFNWQRSYRLQEPIALAPGDQVEVTCTYTNHTGATVNWGESTDAEMCIGVTYLTEDG